MGLNLIKIDFFLTGVCFICFVFGLLMLMGFFFYKKNWEFMGGFIFVGLSFVLVQGWCVKVLILGCYFRFSTQ